MIKNVNFFVTEPISINEIFYIPPDKSVWKSMEYLKKYYGKEGKSVNIPDRKKIFTKSELLVPKEKFKNFFSDNSLFNYGIYLLFFKDFENSYVGITAKYSYLKKDKSTLKKIKEKNREGFLERLRKHRAKCTGTDVGIGVNHTQRWREIAKERYSKYGPGDIMVDCCVAFIIFKNHEEEKYDDKGKLAWLEDKIKIDISTVPCFENFSGFKCVAKTDNNLEDRSYNPKFEIVDINKLV